MKKRLLLVLFWFFTVLPCSAEKPARTPQAERAAWHHILKWPDVYEETYRKAGLPGHSGLSFYPLSDALILVEIQTYLGAYQPGQIFMLYHKQKREAHLLQLPMFALTDEGQRLVFTREEISGYVDFDTKSKTLHIYSKYRGVGGCGRYGSWAFSDDEARLLAMREQSCATADAQNENMILNPQQFPLIWPL